MELNTDTINSTATLHWKNPRIEIRLKRIYVAQDDYTQNKIHFTDYRGVEGWYNYDTGRLGYAGMEIQVPEGKRINLRDFFNDVQKEKVDEVA